MYQSKILVVPGGNEKYKSKSKCKYNNKLKSSNFSKDKMQLMDALRIREFFSKSLYELPSGSVSVNEDSLLSIDLQSVLLRVLRRVILLSSTKGSVEESGKSVRNPYHNYKED